MAKRLKAFECDIKLETEKERKILYCDTKIESCPKKGTDKGIFNSNCFRRA